jgi:xanthine dehydrogenase YagS FAD-binding subunit
MTPWIETALRADELIVGVILPPPKFAKNAYYLKARDRNSYAFALISVAAGLEMDGDHVRSVGLALGGVALKPWRRVEAEKVLVGKPVGAETFTQAAEILVQGAKGYEHNTFKIETSRTAVVFLSRSRRCPAPIASPAFRSRTAWASVYISKTGGSYNN